MRRSSVSRSRASTAVALVAAVVAVLVVLMVFPGIGVGEPDTIAGGTPTAVLTNTEPEVCAVVDKNGTIAMPTPVVPGGVSDLLVSFTAEWSGFDTRTELLITFEVVGDDESFRSTPFEWGVSSNTRTHSSGTVMWSFGDVPAGGYTVQVGARVDPIPGAQGGGSPSATLENCALTVFVIP
jgi:hypothetical protein